MKLKFQKYLIWNTEAARDLAIVFGIFPDFICLYIIFKKNAKISSLQENIQL